MIFKMTPYMESDQKFTPIEQFSLLFILEPKHVSVPNFIDIPQ